VTIMSDASKDKGEPPEIRDCIARAKKEAGGDPVKLIKLLEACFAQSQRATGLRSIPVRGAVDRTPKASQVLKDPRFQKNVQDLLRRTQGGDRVIGGRAVRGNQYLDCVAIGNDEEWCCTGTLIARNVVVTAAHCQGLATRVLFGNDVTDGEEVDVRTATPHPEYDDSTKLHDLMVLVLKKKVANIPPRKLASKAIIDAAKHGRVVGFGNTDPGGEEGYGIKRQVDLPIASIACQGKYDGKSDATAYACHRGREIVAGKPLLRKDSCTGDSGGPLYVEGPHAEWLLAGATSRATNSAEHDCGDGGIYVRLDAYRAWIARTAGVRL